MVLNIAINGFGRIGRMVFKAALLDPKLNVVAINDLTDTGMLAHLLKYDSVQPYTIKKVTNTRNMIRANGTTARVYKEKDPSKLPWKDLGVDVVCESTGFFRTKEKASLHLDAGAKKVLISAPAKGDIPVKTIVMGVNDSNVRKSDKILSNASCTTNCLAPMVKILNDSFKIQQGFFTTIHSYTSTQNIVDGPNKDWRRARAAALNMIPTTTGAAIAVEEVIPQLKGKLDGMAVRAPTPSGSLTDLTTQLKKTASVDKINLAFKKSATNKMKNIIRYTDEEIVSSDIVGSPESMIFDSLLTKSNKNLAKVFGWYDNEWGYSNRMIDLMKLMK